MGSLEAHTYNDFNMYSYIDILDSLALKLTIFDYIKKEKDETDRENKEQQEMDDEDSDDDIDEDEQQEEEISINLSS